MSYVDEAEEIMRKISNPKNNKDCNNRDFEGLTTGRLRTLLSVVAPIYNAVLLDKSKTDDLKPEIVDQIQYARVQFLYQSGREKDVKELVKAKVTKGKNLLEKIGDIGSSKKKLIEFYHYMEALVAWRAYLDGSK
ncbi:MAG: type III-A CRISPR-associated protein Csm2 [Candidatus Ancillula sp.]|jgi:CRISPR-associated protein Csm2|nr:type III-A CRISPR-associated protein Csm2 [Candidatus Ancillula sp.]